ncbi:MAG: hypothetical protein WBA76_15350 [Phormidesmis sp.]
MSVLTFEILSVDLTRALFEQRNTPPKTTARCTLGRDKVMVLVEYALENADAKPLAAQTLDWLEQWLRHQFDTTGLPEEAADLAGYGSEVSVQLFLKHLSDSKPFTMRSFLWKLDDSFEDLFGASFDIDNLAPEQTPFKQGLNHQKQAEDSSAEKHPISLFSPAESAREAASLRAETPFVRMAPASSIRSSSRYEMPVFHRAEDDIDDYLEVDDPENSIELETQKASPFAEGSFANASAQMEERQQLLEAERFDAVLSGLSDVYFPDDERVPSELDDEHLQLELEPELDSEDRFNLNDQFELENETDFQAELDRYTEASLESLESDVESDLVIGMSIDELLVESASELDLLGDSSDESDSNEIDSDESDSDEFNLPTLEQPGANVSDIDPLDADFFTLDENGASQASLSKEAEDLSADLEASLDASLEAGSGAAEKSRLGSDAFGLSGFEVDPDGFASELDGFEGTSVANDIFEPTPEPTFEPTLENDTLDAESDDAEFDDGPEISAALPIENELAIEAEGEGSEAYEDEELEAYEGKALEEYEDEESETYEYEDDPAYYLEGEATEGEPIEEVALVDETEVQRQREQWQQQSKTNPWVFAGALGFVFIGVLGFVLTRPCGFGSCDRLQTAQENSTEALDNLRVDSSLDSVTDAKQQLKRSISLLAPIPVWSRYYGQAQESLPVYKGQVQALDYVSEAQQTAYQAAVESQDPPHPVSTWKKIAEGWGAAASLLERVPTDSPVRELTERKLVEYRANRATILVRVDTESKAEVSLRQAQQAASLGTKQIESASSVEAWEAALASWESAVDNLSLIPQGTYAHAEAQKLLPEYLKKLDEVRDRTEQERSASRTLIQAKQLATDAQKAQTDEQWSVAAQNWKTALSQLQTVRQGTVAHTEAQALQGLYTTSLAKAENNLQVALRFQPIEPNFFAACGSTDAQKCTYSIRSGNVRLDLSQGYDKVIDQSITPPDQRAAESAEPQLVGQSNQLLQDITLLSAQVQVPIALYNAKGDFLATYRPDLKGFTR